ncbi:hypothetical protein U9M48_034555 [Paspalum notatum var. saurae]|uniref:Uncharacterized protein n=1 Tax=Paspalum notatum var. saurae TaxID=547442 RepID=A0AAQ3X821_PASNO
MEIVLGALPSLLPKLGELLKDEYNLQTEVKGGIRFLKAELETMKAALEDISETPPDQLPRLDKIWARNVRELSYDIEDNIDSFMVQFKGSESAKKHGFKKFIDKTLGSLILQPKIRRKISTDIRDIKNQVIEVHERRRRYEVNHSSVDKHVEVDPRAMVRYEDVAKLVGIDEAKEEVIKILTEVKEVPKKQQKIVSIVGFGGLGKTTLANVVYEKLRAQFDCSAFVSVSQTPDIDKLFKDMLYQVANYNTTGINVVDELRKFLHQKRYLIIIDDIWEISHWNMIRYALPDDNDEYRIITTTRIFSVAEQIGNAYKMKPLSIENSRILMCERIFGKEDKARCLDVGEQLAEVSNRILKKCAGVPLAIITISSLLASKRRDKLEWYDVCNSIGAGLGENNVVKDMRKVLSLSYYAMPSHLRTCLLYLSMYPEDYEIYKDRLIWLWIAEGFIQSGKQERSLFEIGESYFNELVNRSMIQPKYDSFSGTVESCSVHDMVLELIYSLSSEENFLTIWNHVDRSSASEKVRRLSLQNSKAGHGIPKATMSTEHVRSVVVFPPAIGHVPALPKFRVLRVLDLEFCRLRQDYSVKYLGNLLHLRYLGLRCTSIGQLPDEIGNLRFLRSLDVSDNEIRSLPSAATLLTNLQRLRIDEETRVPRGIGSLTALEELSDLGIHDDSSPYIIQALGHLKDLRVLRMAIRCTEWNKDLNESLVESLNKLHKIQILDIYFAGSGECNLDGWGVVIAPRHLRELVAGSCWLSTLPAWVNPSLLPDLSLLPIQVRGLLQQDLEILGRLPALRHLDLRVGHEDLGIHGRFSVGAGSFPCLVLCWLLGFGGLVVFQHGAMPRVVNLQLQFQLLPVQETREINCAFDLGLGNLPSLQDVRVRFRSGGSSEEELQEAKAAVRHAIEVHPNHPELSIN